VVRNGSVISALFDHFTKSVISSVGLRLALSIAISNQSPFQINRHFKSIAISNQSPFQICHPEGRSNAEIPRRISGRVVHASNVRPDKQVPPLASGLLRRSTDSVGMTGRFNYPEPGGDRR
jgi:hypothetical protein